MTEDRVPDRRARDEHPRAGDEERGAFGRDVEHDREHGEEQERRAQVLLADHHDEREAPRQDERPEMPGGRDAQPRDAAAAGREYLAFVDEVSGQEDDEKDLRQFAGLEVDRAEPNPQAGAIDLTAEPGRKGKQQREEPEEEEGVPVPLEQMHAPDEQERPDERGDTHHGPDRLARCKLVLRVAVDTGDDDEPDAVQERGQRQQRAVGARCEPAHREVRDHVQADQHGQEEPDVGRKRRALRQSDEDVAAHRDDDGEEPEAELGVATLVRGEAHDGGAAETGGAVDSGGVGVVVAGVRSSMPWRRRAT